MAQRSSRTSSTPQAILGSSKKSARAVSLSIRSVSTTSSRSDSWYSRLSTTARRKSRGSRSQSPTTPTRMACGSSTARRRSSNSVAVAAIGSTIPASATTGKRGTSRETCSNSPPRRPSVEASVAHLCVSSRRRVPCRGVRQAARPCGATSPTQAHRCKSRRHAMQPMPRVWSTLRRTRRLASCA